MYKELRQTFSEVEENIQRTKFFTAVLEMRGRLEEQDKRTQDTLVVGDTSDSS